MSNKKMFVVVLFEAEEATYCRGVRGPFKTETEAVEYGLIQFGGELELDEWGRYIDDDGSPYFSVHPVYEPKGS